VLPVPPQSESSAPTGPASLPLPGPTDTPLDLHRTMEQQLQPGTGPAAVTPAGTPAPPPLLPDAGRTRESHPFVFHGEAREYFRIWIVNTLLTLLTCGIYAAWAKVRKRRYLRGSTELMGHRFDYRADPTRILIGNILVALMFLAYMVVGEVYPEVRIGALVVGLVLLPWVVVRSLAFNAHNTVYRGMRFYSRQSYAWAALTYLGQWFFIVLTLGFYYPAWVRNRKRFVITSHRLGDAFFRFESKSGPFYSAYLWAGLIVIAGALLGGAFTAVIAISSGSKLPTTTQLIPVFLAYGFAVYLSRHYVYARLFNHIWSNTRLDEHQFTARLAVNGWLKLQIVNLAAIIVSCGLLYPWATVRSARYALSSLHFHPAGPVDKISRLGRSAGSAVGDTTAEFVGLDIGL
jgi:uncharacterized membrane protein YjgN (DUF898 family)